MFKLIFSVAAVTALAQVLQLISQPLLTYLYTKENFGYLSIVASIVTFSALICNFQFNNLILISKEDTNHLFSSGLYFSIFMEGVVFLFLLIFSYLFFDNNENILVILTILYLLFYCFNVLFRAVMLRKNKNRVYSFGILFRSLVVVFSQVILYFYYKEFGLILGIVVGEFSLIIFGFFNAKELVTISNFSIKEIIKPLIMEKKFLLIGTVQELTSTSMFLAPLLLIIYKYSYEVGGEFSVIHKLAWGPAFLLAQVVSPILLQHLSRENFHDKFLFNKKKSILFFIVTSLVAYYSCESIFRIIIKDDWYDAIWMSKYIVIWVLSFIISLPHRVLLRAERKQKIQFFIDVVVLFLFLSVLVFPISFYTYIYILVLGGMVGNFMIIFSTKQILEKRGWK